jgi:hypothetical protein
MKKTNEIFLSDLPDSDFSLGGIFDDAARKAGHCSGKSAANDLNLWGCTVSEALEIINGDSKNLVD